jgi:hypothetical protein
MSIMDKERHHYQLVSDLLLEQHSITYKLCDAKFESLGDMQRHVLTEHMQKGDYQIPSENRGK